MKPFAKTFRASKVHPAKDCGICAEDTGLTKSFPRREGTADINSQLDAELEPEEVTQEEPEDDR